MAHAGISLSQAEASVASPFTSMVWFSSLNVNVHVAIFTL